MSGFVIRIGGGVLRRTVLCSRSVSPSYHQDSISGPAIALVNRLNCSRWSSASALVGYSMSAWAPGSHNDSSMGIWNASVFPLAVGA